MKNIFKIIKISKPLHHIVYVLAGLILATAVSDLLAPFFSKLVVDEITARLDGTGGDAGKLVLYVFLGFGLALLGVLFNTLTERVGDHFAGRMRQFLTETFYIKVLKLPQSYFDSEVSGKISNQLNRGIFTIQNFLNGATNFMLPTFVQSILTIAVLAYYNLAIAAFMSLLFPVFILISYRSTIAWGKKEEQKNKIDDATRGRLQEVIHNIKLVKSFNTEQSEFNLVSQNLTESNKIYAKQSQDYHVYDFFRNFALNVILLIVNLIIFYSAFEGRFSLGELVLLIQLINQARRPLFATSYILGQIQQAESGSKEYFEVLDLVTKEDFVAREKLPKTPLIENPEIIFENVSFKYESSDMVLNDISLKIGKNEVVALVGPSGAGKSTIINLILKFYDATKGQIKLNGKSYAELSAGEIRQNVALVFQDNELFSSTIRENVAYGQTGRSDDEIIDALKKANAWDFVNDLKDGLDAQIGERGVRLSGGQKQRIQIARAILKNAPILILDEATSSLDAKSELEVQTALEKLVRDRLVIVIAHRFSTIQNASKIIVLDNRQIVDMGTPDELAKRPGIYSELLQYQIQGNQKLLRKFELY